MKTKNLAVGALVGLLTLALWYNFLLKPTNAQASKVKAETETERTKLQPLQAQLAQANIDAAHAGTFKARLAVLKHAVPDSPELANFIRDANAIAEASNISWQSVTHGPPTPGDAGVASITVGIQIKGTYEQVLDYLGRIAEAATTGRHRQRAVQRGRHHRRRSRQTGGGASTGPFSGASELTVTITARMFETPAALAAATGGTGGTRRGDAIDHRRRARTLNNT